MTASKHSTDNTSPTNHRERPQNRERVVTPDGLVFRPEVRMLNGTGPLNAPLRVLHVDGSAESCRAYQACDEAGVDFSVVVTEPGDGVLLHDGFLHADFDDLEAIERGIAFAKDLYSRMAPLIDEALSTGPSERAASSHRKVADAVEREREERERRLNNAITPYRERYGR